MIKRLGKKDEDSVADALGGKTTPASGAKWHSKGDVKASRFILQCKATEKAQFVLKKGDIVKAKEDALLEGKEFALSISYYHPKTGRLLERVYLIDSETFERLQSLP